MIKNQHLLVVVLRNELLKTKCEEIVGTAAVEIKNNNKEGKVGTFGLHTISSKLHSKGLGTVLLEQSEKFRIEQGANILELQILRQLPPHQRTC